MFAFFLFFRLPFLKPFCQKWEMARDYFSNAHFLKMKAHSAKAKANTALCPKWPTLEKYKRITNTLKVLIECVISPWENVSNKSL